MGQIVSGHLQVVIDAEQALNPAAKGAYSPGVLDYLVQQTGETVAHPWYHRNRATINFETD